MIFVTMYHSCKATKTCSYISSIINAQLKVKAYTYVHRQVCTDTNQDEYYLHIHAHLLLLFT